MNTQPNEYQWKVINLFLVSEMYDIIRKTDHFWLHADELETLERCEEVGMSPEACAVQMSKLHRWQRD